MKTLDTNTNNTKIGLNEFKEISTYPEEKIIATLNTTNNKICMFHKHITKPRYSWNSCSFDLGYSCKEFALSYDDFITKIAAWAEDGQEIHVFNTQHEFFKWAAENTKENE